ncbi:MAG: hypothetical protein K1060chlam5_01009 [Candidatus Anoxychlamydiales bacterium]|nr:hypothetical protein [Candidatus Anoxychlamydiales bacterium]
MKKKFIVSSVVIFILSLGLYLFFSNIKKENPSVVSTFSLEEQEKLKEIEKGLADKEFNFDKDLTFDKEEVNTHAILPQNITDTNIQEIKEEEKLNSSNIEKETFENILSEKTPVTKSGEKIDNEENKIIDELISSNDQNEALELEKESSNDDESKDLTLETKSKIIETDYDDSSIETPTQKTQVEDQIISVNEEKQNILISKTKGLILSSSENSISYLDPKDVKGLEVIDLKVPGNHKKLSKELEPLFLGKDLTSNDLLTIKQAVIAYYSKYNRPLITVHVPEQDITSGVVSMVVCESKLNEVVVIGNKYTNSDILKNRISTKKNKYLNEKKLREDLDFLNRNPFRKVDLIYSEGEDENSTDIELLTYDRFPLRAYAGSDNTGIKITERNRWFAGFNWNEAFTIDSVLSYQYTASYNVQDFQSHTANYIIFLPWQNILTLYGGYSLVKVEHNIPTTLRTKGRTSQASMLYTVPLPIFNHITHDFIFGFDFKRTNTNYLFTEFDNLFRNRTTNLTQFLLSYNFNYDKAAISTNTKLDIYFSPFEWLPDQSNANFNSLRTDAKNQYLYARLYFSNLIKFPNKMLFSFTFRGQLSNENLLPSEMLGVGGYDSVRGYYERDLNGDGGIIINIEFRSPSYSLLKNLKYKNAKDGLQFIAFFDYGLSEIHKTLLQEHKTEYIFGFGPGLRYVLDPYFSTRLDWGFKGKHNPSFGGGSSLVHFSVNLNY